MYRQVVPAGVIGALALGCGREAGVVKDSGGLVECLAPTTVPAVGETTADFPFDGDCSCVDVDPFCHRLWVATVDAVTATGVRLSVEKVEGDPPGAEFQWEVIDTAGVPLACTNLDQFDALASGRWPPGEARQVVDVPLWEGERSSAATEAWNLYFVSGGSGHPDERVWWQFDAVWVERTCGQ